MNHHENGWRKKLRHGSVSLGITVAVLVAVLLLNIGMTALSSGRLWYTDLTPDSPYNTYIGDTARKYATLYTLMDETVSSLDYIFENANANRGGKAPVEVDIIFCAEPDLLMRNEQTRYVYYTALLLQKKYPDNIKVSYRDVWDNPSKVDEFRSTKYSNIYQTDVIVASGSEFRVNTVRSYYAYDSDAATNIPVAYNGQKQFVKQILDVTGAERPICCLTTNHGEPFANLDLKKRNEWPEYKEFMNLIEGAGYEIQYLDLAEEEIPENCRLIITFDPQKDFASSFGNDKVEVSESKKLAEYLNKSYAYMFFADADTPFDELDNMVEFLELWGIQYKTAEGLDSNGNTVLGNYQISDPNSSLAGDGERFWAQYPSGNGLGNAILYDVISSAAAPKIFFDNAIAIDYADNFGITYVQADETLGTPAFSFGYREGNGVARSIFDMFLAGTSSAMANYQVVANGEVLERANGDPLVGVDVFRVMTISREPRTVEEGQGLTAVTQNAYVCAVGSTSFVSDQALGSSEYGTPYGNTDALLATLRYIGKEVNPVGISFVYLYDPAIGEEYFKETDPQTGALSVKSSIITTTVVLAALPAAIATGAGIFVLVRRRVRH
ncbi:MAG: hypothetical protein IJW29_05485 [Clostridia bacterium]|nr:hypothetical protein [Clostridia bacterium]